MKRTAGYTLSGHKINYERIKNLTSNRNRTDRTICNKLERML
jgi:hypothetical protein